MAALIGITIVILPDKQRVELPDELADKDETLRASLEMYVPEIRNAELKRYIKEGQKYVEVIKKAGSKGAMTDDQYQDTQNKLVMVGALLGELDLKEFITRIEQANSIGPILDPTSYKAGMGRLQAIRGLAFSAIKMQEAHAKLAESVKESV